MNPDEPHEFEFEFYRSFRAIIILLWIMKIRVNSNFHPALVDLVTSVGTEPSYRTDDGLATRRRFDSRMVVTHFTVLDRPGDT